LTNPTGGTCASVAGPMTCMRIIVSVGGQIRMCNPNVASGTPQGC
jgi:type IV fimbrial biogenesis protein FimT